MSSRRGFLAQLAWSLSPIPVLLRQQQGAAPPRPAPQGKGGGSAADTLAVQLGNTVAAVGPLDNDPGVIAIERKLRCSCGCTLDVYTCRTTDFSCTYSPAMHAKVVSRVQGGMSADEIVQWFVSQPEYGEKVLMAPAARGFNLMGYVVPGVTVLAFGLALAAWLTRKRVPPVDQASPVANTPDTDTLARLQRALDDVES